MSSEVGDGRPAGGVQPADDRDWKTPQPPFLSRVGHAAQLCSLQGLLKPVLWFRDWREWLYPPEGRPDIIKLYECRPHLPVRIFFPSSYDQTSPTLLPTLFTIHGGGFSIGVPRDDDEYNRYFSDTHSVVVIALNYSKAPWAPFPTGLHDLEALYLALLADESIPIDRSRCRTAVLGFSAGGNLALALSQLPAIRECRCPPQAAVSVYGCLDLSRAPARKTRNRPYKPALGAPRGAPSDALLRLAPTFDWGYVPYGQNLRDPLLSPAFAARSDLPPHVCLVAAELDMLAHESWRLACRLGNEVATGRRREVPDPDAPEKKMSLCGQEEVASVKGALKGPEDDRFGWEQEDGDGSVKWILVPDALHGFDNVHMRRLVGGGEETMVDAEMKTREYVQAVGEWLLRKVWKV
ncbi:Alpha/beta-hydrolase [Pleurostoma richardsiae]|uniref:Alpha/beta-hydrolase n=1 Tax=Pleurostoma richardsiae TaxID=41990 RepID=A0AA38VHE2_9PEZI|nr:Alpha/beta-hydrolase [Pleurostoma richardsiae]